MRPPLSCTDAHAGVVAGNGLADRAAEPHHHAAVAQLVDEILDQFTVDEVEHAVARLDQGHRHVEGAEKMVAYSTPITPAPITVSAARQMR